MKRNLLVTMVVAIVVVMVVSASMVNVASSCTNPLPMATNLSPPTSQSEDTAGANALSVSVTDLMINEACAVVAITISTSTGSTLTATARPYVGVANSNCQLTNSDAAMGIGIGAPRKTPIFNNSVFSCVVANVGIVATGPAAVLSNGDIDSFSNRMGMICRDGLIALTLSQTDMQAWMMGAPRKFVSNANLVSLFTDVIWQTSIDQANSPPAAIIEVNTIATRPTSKTVRWV